MNYLAEAVAITLLWVMDLEEDEMCWLGKISARLLLRDFSKCQKCLGLLLREKECIYFYLSDYRCSQECCEF